MTNKHNTSDTQTDDHPEGGEGSGKVADAHNSAGDKDATQLNQARRTPESRGDRDTHIGSGNQTQSRKGSAGGSGGGGSGGAG